MCLQKIQPTINLSFTIPRSMSARYQYGITVADACKKVGFKSDIGYQTILYGNIVDMRKILMFLIEKLPKEIENIIEYRSKRCTILKELKKSLSTKRKPLNSSLFPNYSYLSVPLETGVTVPGHKRNCTPAEWRHFCINSLKYITEQPSDLKYLIPSLITHNTKRLLNIYEFELRTTDDLSESRIFKEEIEKNNSKQSSYLNPVVKNVSKDQVEKISKESESAYIEELISKNNELKNLTLKQHSTKINLMLKLEKLEKEIAVQEKSLNIIDNPEVITKLKSKVDAAPDKIKRMGNKWSKYEIEQKLILSELNDELIKKRAKNIKLETVHGNEKLKLQNIFEDIQKKEDIIKICRNDLDSKPNYNSRSSYTQRILEIISNIEKQKKEINKNLYDTKQVQKEINSLDGKVERCFISIDELMFKVAKKDDIIRKCYKLLAAIHSNSSSIITSVKQTGTIGREIKDLEEQIENENPHQATANVQKLRKDLELVKNEQLLLLKKIKN
ncbi:coiled-coil domain-containing protein 22 [Acyrthosiphon pisum]|uniref:Coiled-coil domain-containing protein 22 homolog n=1 Tax=Acyrthosiphon pisum TaxID=7029 RepID=A0A8R2H5Z1_ACYPI|nr:coiled-coil domain-containing protein 22 [Acyrthosiphon pisum]XP_016658932.1 coiled-coil domain-containing protein 22 [Acyrthosiphon pisum]|eukprot:XP_003240049.1 PREDICTED: coiled-coil domain-containing protein 22 [Acyrthosiphon pisum]